MLVLSAFPLRHSFNPRVREGRDLLLNFRHHGITVSIHASARDATSHGHAVSAYGNVSIHASARDATNLMHRAGVGVPVSIHASARDATCRQAAQHRAYTGFNPRVREGRDVSARHFQINKCVSIHASARDATRRPQRSCLSSRCFNPRVREGRDVPDLVWDMEVLWFQSTRPRGTRRAMKTQ